MKIKMDIWWGRLTAGILSVLFGFMLILWPGLTLEVFIMIFGAILIVLGIFGIVYGLQAKMWEEGRFLFITEGVLTFIIGAIAIAWPGISALVVLYFVAAWLVIMGLSYLIGSSIVAKYNLAFYGKGNKMLVMMNGLLALLLGIVLFIFPGEGILAFVTLIGLFAIIIGMLNIFNGLLGKKAAQ